MLKKISKTKIIVFASFFLLSFAFFFSILQMNLWDYDFWWHIASGRYIVAERHLPAPDPFSFTTVMEENKNPFLERENFILKQYWIAQILFYFLFKYSGAPGLIFLRSLLILLAVLIVLWRFQRSRVSFYISYPLIFLLFFMSSKSLGERPVLFSIFFTAGVLFLLEEFRERRNRILFLIVPIMLFWANMHGGFILGVIIISAFMLDETLKIYRAKSSLTRQEKKIFFGAASLALLCTLINPSGWDAFVIAFSSKYDIFLEGIQEYESPIRAYTSRLRAFDFPFFTAVFLSPLILILRNRKINLAHVILLLGFTAMAMKASRYGTFFGIVGITIMGMEFDLFYKENVKARLSIELNKKLEYVFAICLLISSVLFLFYFNYYPPKLQVAKGMSVPVAAADFIEKNSLSGNMFNDYGYGGYLTWRLYPKKNFIDSRSLNKAVMDEYAWITEATKKVEGVETLRKGAVTTENIPLWQTLLDHYKINYILMALSDINGTVYPLILQLLNGKEWVPVFADMLSIIFVKNSDENREVIEKYRIPKEIAVNLLITKFSYMALSDSLNPRAVISLGYIFLKTERPKEAITAYKYALARWKDPELEKKIKELDEKFDKQGKIINQ